MRFPSSGGGPSPVGRDLTVTRTARHLDDKRVSVGGVGGQRGRTPRTYPRLLVSVRDRRHLAAAARAVRPRLRGPAARPVGLPALRRGREPRRGVGGRGRTG